MATSPSARKLADEVATLRDAAFQHRKGSHWFLLGTLMATALVGLVTWFSQRSADRDDLHFQLALGLAATVFFFACLLGRLLFPRPSAICPQCGCDWNLESENNTQRWLAWQRCPGCGLVMSGEDEEV